jgi:hypothetical protein
MPAATTLQIKLVDFCADGAYAGGDNTEFEVAKTNLTTKTWQSLEFALSDFNGLAARAHLANDLLRCVHQAALDEIGHADLCFR